MMEHTYLGTFTKWTKTLVNMHFEQLTVGFIDDVFTYQTVFSLHYIQTVLHINMFLFI